MRGAALVLGAGAALIGALAGGPATATPGKVSKAQAGYQNAPRGAARCDRCALFQPPSTCKIVDGAVVPTGSCTFFAPRPN